MRRWLFYCCSLLPFGQKINFGLERGVQFTMSLSSKACTSRTSPNCLSNFIWGYSEFCSKITKINFFTLPDSSVLVLHGHQPPTVDTFIFRDSTNTIVKSQQSVILPQSTIYPPTWLPLVALARGLWSTRRPLPPSPKPPATVPKLTISSNMSPRRIR